MSTSDNLALFTSRGLAAAPSVEVDGFVLGAILKHELGVRFVAVHARVSEMDQSIWPNADYARRSARQMFRAGRTR